MSNSMWALVHEAVHGHLLPGRSVNDVAGRALAVLHGGVFRALQVGHLLHHRYSRTPRERAEVYDPRKISAVRAKVHYYARLFGGLYVEEALGSLLSLLPRWVHGWLAHRLDRSDTLASLVIVRLSRRDVLREVRFDTIILIALWSAAFVAYGPCAWMLALCLGLRATLVSLADNAYHYATPLDRPRHALNLQAPRWVTAVLLDFTLHGVHHRYPGLPWHALRSRFAAEGVHYDGTFAEAVVVQFRGPIPEEELEPYRPAG